MGKRFVKTTLAILSVGMLLPACVFAEDAGNMEAAFVGESVLEPDQLVPSEDANSTLPVEAEKKDPTDEKVPANGEQPSEKTDSEDQNSDLDGFISGDASADDEKNKTIHVIIENGTPEEDNGSQITDPVIDSGDYSDGGYSGGGSSSGSSSEKILHKPQILLEDNNLSGQILKAGAAMELSVTFRNKSRSQNVFGLKISLSTETKGIEFERNSFYVQRLTPGEAITLKQKITIAEDCDPGQATISFSLDYEDSKATAATGTETLSFQIIQPSRAKLEASDIPSILYTMDTVEIPIKAMNLGRDKLYNASVRLEADGLNPKETAFLGTIEAGTAAQGSLRVYVKGKSESETQNNSEKINEEESPADDVTLPGRITGKLILTYEDASGNSYEESTEFESEIKEAKIQSLKVEDDQEETNSWWYSIIAVFTGLLVSVILFLTRKLHKKNILLEEARKAASH